MTRQNAPGTSNEAEGSLDPFAALQTSLQATQAELRAVLRERNALMEAARKFLRWLEGHGSDYADIVSGREFRGILDQITDRERKERDHAV